MNFLISWPILTSSFTLFTPAGPAYHSFVYVLKSIHERSWLTNRLKTDIFPSEWKNEILYPLLRTWLKYQAEMVLIYKVQNVQFQAVGS